MVADVCLQRRSAIVFSLIVISAHLIVSVSCAPVRNDSLPHSTPTNSPAPSQDPSPTNGSPNPDTPSPVSPTPTDQDGDGVSLEEDCNDANSDVFPGALESCNGIDDDCDLLIDEDLSKTTFFLDSDRDGFGTPSSTTESCQAPAGYVSNDDDCDDSNNTIHPDAVESCNGIDDNCSGATDEGVLQNFYVDNDTDGYGDASQPTKSGCEPATGYVTTAGDCDDADPTRHPNAIDYCDDIDQNCNGEAGLVEGSYYYDQDADGFGDSSAIVVACEDSRYLSSIGYDCDDLDPELTPVLVSQSAGDASGDGSRDAPYFFIESAVDAPGTCKTILVEAGSYEESLHVLALDDFSLIGLSGSASTTIQASNGDRPLTFERITNATCAGFSLASTIYVAMDGAGLAIKTATDVNLSDLRIQGLTAEGDGKKGGAIYITDGTRITASGLLLSNNSADYGGAIALDSSSLTVTDSVLDQNTAQSNGGAIYVYDSSSGLWTSSLFVDHSQLSNNSANGNGGAVYTSVNQTSILSESVLENNSAVEQGGALYNPGEVTHCELLSNVATEGGAAYLRLSVSVENSIFWNNHTDYLGGAIVVADNTNGFDSYIEMVNNTFIDNYTTAGFGATMYIFDADLILLRNNIVADFVSPEGNACIYNVEILGTRIFDYNDVYSLNGFAFLGLELSETDVEGYLTNIELDPQFSNYSASDYGADGLTLKSSSPCIDAGSTEVGVDPDGSDPDIGAYGGPGASSY